MNKRKTLSRKRLQIAYQFLDKDGNGNIDFDEIRVMFSQKGFNFNDTTFQDFITEVDLDGDGQISFDEFERMMLKLANNNFTDGAGTKV